MLTCVDIISYNSYVRHNYVCTWPYRDWSEIVWLWLLEISRFKNQPCNRLYPKNPLE